MSRSITVGDQDEEVNEEEVLEETNEEEEDRGDAHISEEDENEEDSENEDESEQEEDDEDGDDEGGELDEEGDDKGKGAETEADTRIPIARLNQVIEQREEATKRSEWLESQLEKLLDRQLKVEEQKEADAKPKYDFETNESKYIDLILEGETAKATTLRRQIDSAKQTEFEALIRSTQETATESSTTASKAVLEESRFETTRDNMENKHPFLNSEDDSYNEEAVDTVNTLMAGYLAAGKTKSQALKLAVEKVSPMYKLPGKATKERTTKQRKKNAKAAQSQPPKIRGKRTQDRDTGSIDVKALSDKQYSSLTRREKAVLRGDVVA